MSKVLDVIALLRFTLPLLLAAAFLGLAMTQPKQMTDLTGTCTPVMRDMVGTPCWSPDPVVPDEVALLEEAAQVAGLTVGMECWDPAEGRLATHVVVRGEAGVALLEFNDETFAAAQRGEFETIKACEA